MAGQQLETGACDLKVANSSLAATENLEAEAVAASASSEWEVYDAGEITHSFMKQKQERSVISDWYTTMNSHFRSTSYCSKCSCNLSLHDPFPLCGWVKLLLMHFCDAFSTGNIFIHQNSGNVVGGKAI